jgi:lipopolysaccharide transport system permease protein
MKIDANEGYSIKSYLAELYHNRQVLQGLAIRQLKIRYSNASLGLLWAVIQPLIVLGMLLLVFTNIAGFPTEFEQSPLAYALVGLAVWMFISSSFTSTINIALSSREIIGKVYFPRAYLALIALSESGIIMLFCLLGSILAGSWVVETHTLFVLPFLLILVAFTAFINLIVVMAVLVYPDTRFIAPVIIRVLLLISPITYAPAVISSSTASVINYINPIAALIDLGRYAISGFPLESYTVYTITFYFVILVIGVLPLFVRFDRMIGDLI